MEVRDLDTSTGFIVFECDDDEDWKTLSSEKKDTRDVKIEPSIHEDMPQEYGADTEGALVIHEDLKTRDEVKKLREGYSFKDLRYANTSRTQVILPSYKEAFREQTTRRVKKKKEMHICTKSREAPTKG